MTAKLDDNYDLHQHPHTHTHIYTRTHARAQTVFQITQTFPQETLLMSANRRPCWFHKKRGWIRDAGTAARRSVAAITTTHWGCWHSSGNQEFATWVAKILLTRFSVIEMKIFSQIHERHITARRLFSSEHECKHFICFV